jgi:CHAT domain-containing protein/tetratricopeptide (TPR) repeat protein
MSTSLITKALAGLTLLGLAVPASAEYFTYQGEMQFQPAADAVCSAMSAGVFHVSLVGRNDGSPHGAIEAYLDGDQIVHAYIRGAAPGELSVAFIGDTAPSHTLRLRDAGNGSFVGELQGNSVLAAIFRCGFVDAHIKLSKASGKADRAAFESAADQFALDARAGQAVIQGLRGKTKAAIPALQVALAHKQENYSPEHPQLLAYYWYLAQVHFADGSIPMTIRYYRSAAAVCEKSYVPQSACAGFILPNLGISLANDGLYEEAESTIRQALDACDKAYGPGSPMRGAALNGLAFVLANRGRFGEADTALTEALALNKTWPNPVNGYLGTTMEFRGVLYQYTGQYKKAAKAMLEAWQIDAKSIGQGDPATVGVAVTLADTFRADGQLAKAEPLARAAVAAAQEIAGPDRQDHPALSKALTTLAQILTEQGKFAEAEALCRRAIANTTRYFGPDHPNVAYTELYLANILHATGRDQEALSVLNHASVVAHTTGNQFIAWHVAGELMQIYASGPFTNRVQAIFFGKEAVNVLQRMRGNLSSSSSESQQGFVSTAEVSSVYRTLAGLLIDDGRPSEAQQVLAMVKEQEFYEYTQRAAPADAPKTVATLNSSEQQLDELDRKYISLGNEYGALQEKFKNEGEKFSAADRAQLDRLRKAMDAAQAEFESQVNAIAMSANDPEAQRRRRTEINDYSRAFQGTLKDMGHDAVIAQYIVLDDRVAILLASPNAVIARESKIKRQDLYAQAVAFRKALSNPNEDPKPLAQALYQVLIAPIAGDLRQAGAKTLMLDLDGVLRYVPFSALYDGKNYLVESTSVVMVTEAVRDKLGQAPLPNWSVWGLGLTKAGPGYAALPYADTELNAIAGQKGILSGKVMLDQDFTESTLREGLDRSFPIIHIASHFQFTSGSMDDSFLLLGDGSHLTLGQIKTRLNFSRVELLTLSACETALGDDSTPNRGVEVEGLGAIAQQAGAKAVLATLWPVADESTAALMRTLYQAHKVNHLDKADALRQAQIALLKGSARIDEAGDAHRGLTRADSAPTTGTFKVDPSAPYSHPFYWAPFILMGNWL